jgi:hypothetical protein
MVNLSPCEFLHHHKEYDMVQKKMSRKSSTSASRTLRSKKSGKAKRVAGSALSRRKKAAKKRW